MILILFSIKDLCYWKLSLCIIGIPTKATICCIKSIHQKWWQPKGGKGTDPSSRRKGSRKPEMGSHKRLLEGSQVLARSLFGYFRGIANAIWSNVYWLLAKLLVRSLFYYENYAYIIKNNCLSEELPNL